jgi:energy-coupling factor transporter ATP-binding protein EcfA2
LHSPATALNNQFEGDTQADKWSNYFEALEAAGDFGGIGVTDYFSVDGYRKVKAFKDAGHLGKIELILPNIELRIVPVTDRNHPINIHLLVNPSVVDELDDALFSNLTFAFHDVTYKATRHGLTSLGHAFRNDATLDEGAAYREGVGQFKFDVSQLTECLQRHERLRRNSLVVIAQGSQDGNSGIQHDGMRAFREELYRIADCIFSGRPQDREYFLGRAADDADTIRRKFRCLKPCIHGSDAHTCADIGQPDLERHTWIKADTTFEGLKQLCHEPEGRVFIGTYPPPGPVHRIAEAVLSFPESTTLGERSGSVPFCFRGRTELSFAPGLTCVIGGRGTGKSTLLNLLSEKLAPGTNAFFKERPIRLDGDAVSAAEHVSLEYSGDQRGVEFISQNEVEQFALDPSRLTRAISARLRSWDDGRIEREAAKLGLVGGQLQQLQQLYYRRHATEETLRDLRVNRESLNLLVQSFSDERYALLAEALRVATNELRALETSRNRLREALERVRALASTQDRPVEGDDVCAARLREFFVAIELAASNAEQGLELNSRTAAETRAAEAIDRLTIEMNEFLAERGLSPDNVSDVSQATTKLAELSGQIEERERELSALAVAIENAADLSATRSGFEAAVETVLGQVNRTFADANRDLRKIEIRYRYDREAAEAAMLDELNDGLEKAFGRKSRSDHLAPELGRTGSPLEAPLGDLLGTLRQSVNRTGQTLDAYFGQAPNADVFDCMRHRLRVDVNRFTRFDVLYDGVPLDRASFGQRCSAVLVVLLSLGNSPIIIDEPEAHLDSSLIANYLVDLVKRVKSQRQVIFATHNANFVINGDAELIHVIEMEPGSPSRVTSTTIEDLLDRPRLLALEGGERAFLQREGRYELKA